MVLVAGDLATLDEKLLVEGHADRLAGVRLDGQRIDVPRLDRTDPRDLVGRREQQAVADAQHAGFDPAGENPPGVELVDVLDREAQRLVRRHGQAVKPVQHIQYARPLVPSHPFRAFGDVIAGARRDRDRRRGRDADFFEVLGDVPCDLGEAALVEVHEVHLVDDRGDLPDAEQMEQIGVPARGLADALGGIHDHDRGIGAGRPADHVLQELAVARGVDDDVVAPRRAEPDLGRVDGDRLVALGLEGVEHEGPFDRHAAARRDRLELLELARRQRAGVVQQAADERRLAVVDVADDDDFERRLERRARGAAGTFSAAAHGPVAPTCSPRRAGARRRPRARGPWPGRRARRCSWPRVRR